MEHDTTDVSGLIQDAHAGRREALDSLLALYRNYLGILARSRVDATLGGKAGASDVVQETLLHAYEHFPQFRGRTEAELVGWLRRILARRIATLARRYRQTAARDVARERAMDGWLDHSSRGFDRLPVRASATPSQGAQARERSVLLADALASLPEDDQQVIELRTFRQLPWEEVADLTGRTPEAMRKLWTRAVQRLGLRIEGRNL